MKDPFITKLLDIFKRDDIKYELLNMTKPVLDSFLNEIYPYIYLSLIFVSVSFLLILGIFFLLLRSNNIILKASK
tara:strand:+ start:212 stop:436 length:225 start_codon:yes stop_codon:yes gene_type:complete